MNTDLALVLLLMTEEELLTMDNLWILIAHRAGARLFKRDSKSSGIQLLERIEFPDGKLQNREMGTSKQGRCSGGGNPQGHGYTPSVPMETHMAVEFGKKLSSILNEGRTQKRYAYLMLVAEPHMLGIIRGILNKNTGEKIVASVSKDLAWVPDAQIPSYLEESLQNFDSQVILNQIA